MKLGRSKAKKIETVERTRVITAQITVIDTLPKAVAGDMERDDEYLKKSLAETIKNRTNADNVVVTKVKDFYMG